MVSKQVISNVIIILANIALSILIFISVNFSLLSPQKVQELIQRSLIGFVFRRLLFSLLIAVFATLLALLIWIVLKRVLKLSYPSSGTFIKKQGLYLLLISLVSLGFDIYSAIRYK